MCLLYSNPRNMRGKIKAEKLLVNSNWTQNDCFGALTSELTFERHFHSRKLPILSGLNYLFWECAARLICHKSFTVIRWKD